MEAVRCIHVAAWNYVQYELGSQNVLATVDELGTSGSLAQSW